MDYIVLSNILRMDISASLYRKERVAFNFQSYRCGTSPTYALTIYIIKIVISKKAVAWGSKIAAVRS